ncbi:hypothetical protein E4U17_005750 [Claviceps sp. LM77 group G4]|nr:hypothetical protein E4U17_005750 [Claviceps sp. LM77 group G4]KAG6064435.1 hypothetical protein E4U33_006120 [Claviceps sp. LM78 group G4]KAG6073465.1 hypothetical protein E4U16_004664 [Claviceps sp. LM84 group G4]
MDDSHETDVPQPRRPSIVKVPINMASDANCDLDAVHRLPDEIIEQILFAADPSVFASLVLLNSKWRSTSQQPHLYAHHLARCPRYATSPGTQIPPADDEHLPLLRRLFAQEVKRNLFEAYLRPRQTLVKLVSNSISSSSCPGGEGMQFGSSPRGYYILAYNSSRIYVVDVRSHSLCVKRELKIQRRPVSACITDDSNILAVLSTELQVDVYDLQSSPPIRKQSLLLEHSSLTIAISSCGTVLAAVYEGGIEVSSLAASALATEKRAVKCDAVDTLAFSQDGTQILGSTVHSTPPNTVVLTAPYYDPGSQIMDENLSAMWTTSILFPNTSRDCSHAILLPSSDRGEAEWVFTYDRSFETFRAVRLDDLRNGTTYFTGPVPNAASQTKLLPCTLPATTTQGDLVSAGFQGREIWIYGIPEDLDSIPEPPLAGRDPSIHSVPSLGRQNSTHSIPSRHSSVRGNGVGGDRVPQWQVLCDKLRNNLVAGFKVTEIDGVSSVRWVGLLNNSSCKERLVITATGVTAGSRLVAGEEDMDFVDGGRIALLDFDYGLDNGGLTELTIEVGTDDAEPLTEERRDLETEVAIVRRRTVAQKRGGGVRGGGGSGGRGSISCISTSCNASTSNQLLRNATTAAARAHLSPFSRDENGNDTLVPMIFGQQPVKHSDNPTRTQADDYGEFALIEEQEALDAPYAHSSPRSQTTLRRAATAAAVNRQLNPRTADGRPIEYRRADGRAEHPHESDADNWVPPPPPYQKEDPGDMPVFLRGSSVGPLLAPNVSLVEQGRSTAEVPGDEPTLTMESSEKADQLGSQYIQSQCITGDSVNASRLGHVADAPDLIGTPSIHSIDIDDIYGVSPHPSPKVSASAVDNPATGFCSDTNTSASIPLGPGHRVAGPGSRPAAPMLELDIPMSSWCTRVGSTSASASMAEAGEGRLADGQTWPRQQPQGAPASTAASTSRQPQFDSGYPHTAPPSFNPMIPISNDLAVAALFPAPSSGQIASLNKRISQGNPRRLSGNILNTRLWMDSGQGASSVAAPYPQSSSPQNPLTARRLSDFALSSDSDRPQIISTPTGVSGSNDDPPCETSISQTKTPLLAPIPRRPRDNYSSSGGTAQRLENIYSSQPLHVPHMRSDTRPMWIRTPSNSSRRTTNGVNRRRSRAERSAAKNIKDARLRGWNMKKKKKRTNEQQAVGDGSGWVDDVLTPSQPKVSNKCLMM